MIDTEPHDSFCLAPLYWFVLYLLPMRKKLCVSLFVCLSVSNISGLLKNLQMDIPKFFEEG